ncbi:MAG: A/G-specific adenine glycosylase [Gammaproteobacteria bacterium]|nr:A/G-specific adenine glycosylase [Gammaproteobacteria bacterium]
MSDFSDRLLAWFDAYGRKDLPWQKARDPYRIWISEIMLQQTQVQTVIPYYERFMARFPDVQTLAEAPADDVLAHWSGLGYYARARNLHRAAQHIRDAHGGQLPRDFDAMIELPGIGHSTAGAILALAFDDRHPILDGNVKRVLARHRAIDGWPGKAAVLKQLWDVADAETPTQRVADYTQAIMDLGAMVCVRSRPLCEACPVSTDCQARTEGAIERYPGRKAKKDKPLKKTTMVLAVSDNSVFLERRPEAGIWGGLWSLPEVSDVDAWCQQVLNHADNEPQEWATFRHSFSHYDLDIRPVLVRIADSSRTVADNADATWYRIDEAPPGGIAAPVEKLLNTLRAEQHESHR